MFAVLSRMGLSPLLINQIRTLYERPTARVRVNGQVSDPFPITRGTRQGCPLSPLLFAIATEPLAARLRQHHTHRCIGFTSRGLLISMYADDMTVYLTNPKDNLGPVIREFIKYGGLTGIQINWAKSIILSLTDDTEQFVPDFPIRWATGDTKYLGIWVSGDIQELWLANYGRVIDWIERKVQRWKTLPLSLTRVHSDHQNDYIA